LYFFLSGCELNLALGKVSDFYDGMGLATVSQNVWDFSAAL